ncbi:MAG: type II secretion system F family protein [Isosphaeraceae bacterium]
MLTSNPVASAAFVMVSSLVLLVSLLVGGRRTRLDSRLRDLSGQGGPAMDTITLGKIASTTLPRMGTPFIPTDEGERTKLQTRLIHAGLYRRQAMVAFLGVKVLLIAPAFLCVAASLIGVVTLWQGLIIGLCLGIGGLIGPSFWLDRMKRKRQSNFRRALPDALDVLVICLEGGLSLSAGLRRVSTELRTAHPALASELAIVQREVQLGLTSGEALKKMGERSDLEEVRSLASVILQSERLGASLVKALRVHAESLRLKRYQRAEEKAAVAATKVLFPTLLFILPAVFVVVLGPAAFHLIEMFAKMNMKH